MDESWNFQDLRFLKNAAGPVFKIQQTLVLKMSRVVRVSSFKIQYKIGFEKSQLSLGPIFQNPAKQLVLKNIHICPGPISQITVQK